VQGLAAPGTGKNDAFGLETLTEILRESTGSVAPSRDLSRALDEANQPL
jgi:hypothetical protein